MDPKTAISNDKGKTVPKVEYSAKELAYRSDLIRKLCHWRNQRDMKHPELDDMTYVEYYESNRKKDLSYIPPKKNKQDIRIVTGTTREKDTTLLSTLLNLNLEPDITAFDSEDMVVAELGDNMSDIVKKTRENEAYHKKRGTIYREMISQGDVFVEEINVQDFRKIPLTDVEWDPIKDGVSELSFKERLTEVFSGPAVRMVNAKKVYLADIRCEYVEDQPGVAILNVYSRSKAESIYGQWERWKHVPHTVETTEVFNNDGSLYKDWNLVMVEEDRVAEIKIWLPYENRFMIMLNGVMMCPINYPMTAVCPSGEISLSQGKLEPIPDFAYSKSQPSKSKVDQEVLDEMTMLMVEAMRQTRKPAMGNVTKKVYGSSIFIAGKITSGIPKDTLYPLIQNPQIQASEFSFYQLMKRAIDEKTINANFEGGVVDKPQTATEVMELKQQQMLKLGLSMDGVVNLERRMTWNRIYNFIATGTKKFEDKEETNTQEAVLGKIKGSMSVSTTLENGEKGLKIFRFTTKDYPDVQAQEQEEEDMKKEYNMPIRIVYMNPKILRTMKLIWFIIINPTPKSNDKLSQLLFVQNIQTASNLFGIESLNLDYLKQRYAIITNEDYNKMFKQVPIEQMLQQGLGATGQGPTVPQKRVTQNSAVNEKELRIAME